MTKKASHRIPVTPETHAKLRALALGLGLSQGAAIDALVSRMVREGETPYDAGRRELDQWQARTTMEAEPS